MSGEFGEPWVKHHVANLRPREPLAIAIRNRLAPADGFSGVEIDRIIACVNALAGIEDPEAFVREAKARAVLEQQAAADGRQLNPGMLDYLTGVQIARLAAEWKPE